MGPDFILFEGDNGSCMYINKRYVTFISYISELDVTRVYIDGSSKPFEINGNRTMEIIEQCKES